MIGVCVIVLSRTGNMALALLYFDGSPLSAAFDTPSSTRIDVSQSGDGLACAVAPLIIRYFRLNSSQYSILDYTCSMTHCDAQCAIVSSIISEWSTSCADPESGRGCVRSVVARDCQLIWERLGSTSNVRPPVPQLHISERRLRFPTTIEPAESRGTLAMSRTQQVEHTDSISSQDPARDEPKKTKSRRPPSKRCTRHSFGDSKGSTDGS